MLSAKIVIGENIVPADTRPVTVNDGTMVVAPAISVDGASISIVGAISRIVFLASRSW